MKKQKGLQKFEKNKKAKRIIIGSIIGIILLIGGITLYRTFALYEETKAFNVIKGKIEAHPTINSTGQVTMTNGTPKKGEGYSGVSVNCGGTTQATWNNDTWEIDYKSGAFPKTCTVEFWNTEFYNLITTAGIPLTVKTFDQLLANSDYVNKVVTNRMAMELVVNSDYLANGIKDSGNYSAEVKQQFLNSRVASEASKMLKGLPFYLYDYSYEDHLFEGVTPSFAGGYAFKTLNYTASCSRNNTTCLNSSTNCCSTNARLSTDSTHANTFEVRASHANTRFLTYSNTAIDTTNYDTLEVEVKTKTNNSGLKGRLYYGLGTTQTDNTWTVNHDTGTFPNTVKDASSTLDISNLKGNYYFKIQLNHSTSTISAYTTSAFFYKIAFY